MVTPNRRQGRMLRGAYADAWNDRVTTGSDADALLARRLTERGLDEVLETSPATRRYLFDVWRRGVPPTAWHSAVFLGAARKAGRNLLGSWRRVHEVFADAQSEVLRQEGGGELVEDDLPDRVRTVLDEVERPVKVSLPFEASEGSKSLLRGWLSERGRATEWRDLGVWLHMATTSGVARVMCGGAMIGTTSLPATLWKRMSDAAEDQLYADGFLRLRARGDDLEVSGIEGWFPP